MINSDFDRRPQFHSQIKKGYLDYSYLRASIGLSLEALRAG